MTVLPFGTVWPMHYGGLQERATAEFAAFQNWVSGLGLDPVQQVVRSYGIAGHDAGL